MSVLINKPQVLFIGDLNESLPQFVEFQSRFEVVRYQITTEDDLVEKFANEFQNIQAIYGAWLGFVPFGGFRGRILEAAPSSLKVIAICSVGHDGYDGDGMKAKNIALTNVPSTGAAEPVADLVLYNTLLSFRQFQVYPRHFTCDFNHTVKLRKALDETATFNQHEGTVVHSSTAGYSYGHYINNRPNLSPRGHRVVIVGFGNIGQTIGAKLAHLGMEIHYVKRTQLTSEQHQKLGYQAHFHASILDAKDFADLIVIACPATPETVHLISGDVIDQIPRPFRIINIGRGVIIDEQALVDGLKSGKVIFAGLDVFENEPSVHPELFAREDVVLTPHIGASTVENFDFTAIQALRNIEDVLLGGGGLNRVN